MNETLAYYENNANEFARSTRDVAFSEIQDKFLEYIPEHGSILDFGCGSGRDSLYFKQKGYGVTSIDGSEELCKLATEYIGQPVQHILFQDFSEVDAYDGIWACASILHLELETLTDVMKKLADGLHANGVMYTSFKYGDFCGMRNGRFFTYMTEESLRELLKAVPELEIKEEWITGDVREGRESEKWLNAILTKVNA